MKRSAFHGVVVYHHARPPTKEGNQATFLVHWTNGKWGIFFNRCLQRAKGMEGAYSLICVCKKGLLEVLPLY